MSIIEPDIYYYTGEMYVNFALSLGIIKIERIDDYIALCYLYGKYYG